MTNYYQVLNVTPSSPRSEMRNAYRLLAIQSHPDGRTNSKAEDRFLNVSSAWSVLCDPIARKRYDESLHGRGTTDMARLSRDDARHLFMREMRVVAWELEEAGYDSDFIKGALLDEGCPAVVVELITAAEEHGTKPPMPEVMVDSNIRGAEPVVAKLNAPSGVLDKSPVRNRETGAAASGALPIGGGAVFIVLIALVFLGVSYWDKANVSTAPVAPPPVIAAPRPMPSAADVENEKLMSLLATCGNQFDRLANTASAASGLDDVITYKWRLSTLKSKCAARSLECYQNFDELQSIALGSLGLDAANSSRARASAMRAKCRL